MTYREALKLKSGDKIMMKNSTSQFTVVSTEKNRLIAEDYISVRFVDDSGNEYTRKHKELKALCVVKKV